VTNAISSESSPVVCAPDPLPQSLAQFVQVSPISQVRFPHTGPPLLDELLLDDELLEELLDDELLEDELLDDELLEDDDAELLLDEALELDDMPPLVPMDPLLVEDAPLPLEVCPLEFVPVDVTGLPPVPPAPPRFSSSEPPVMSLMVPVQALRAMARAEKANRMRRCMIGDCTALGILVVTEKSDFACK